MLIQYLNSPLYNDWISWWVNRKSQIESNIWWPVSSITWEIINRFTRTMAAMIPEILSCSIYLSYWIMWDRPNKYWQHNSKITINQSVTQSFPWSVTQSQKWSFKSMAILSEVISAISISVLFSCYYKLRGNFLGKGDGRYYHKISPNLLMKEGFLTDQIQ